MNLMAIKKFKNYTKIKKINMKKTSWFILFLLISTIAQAQQENEKIGNIFQGTRFVNSQSANLADDGELMLLIQHRFGDISDGLYQFFGLDQANMRIGFEYGLSDNINLGIGRSTMMKTYDAFGKVRFAEQSSSFPLSIVITAAGSVPTIRDIFPESNNQFSDKFSGNVQLHLAKTIGNFGLQVSPGYIKTGYLPAKQDDFSFMTLGIGGSVRASKKVSFNLEYLYFNENLSDQKPLSIGVDLDTGGHLFQLVLSNSQAMFDQSLFTNTTGDWTKGKLFFGFNLIREFKLKYEEY